ncbi:MAG: class I SAM-dependent methyltransferase [Paracoccaceae bacterium]|nr:class I SAM-dependent methyltransferase [Paracoccaceae bacterium]
MTDDPNLAAAYALETPEDNIRLYRAWAETYDTDFIRETTYQLPRLVAERYLEMGGEWPCLDVGCGTGAIAEHLTPEAVMDGLDLSPEMLAAAGKKGMYRNLIAADLTGALDIADGTYNGLISSGTFTHGHVGPQAFDELIRVMAPGALGAITVRLDNWAGAGFDAAFRQLFREGQVTEPELGEVLIYADAGKAPDGRGQDAALVVAFRKT